MLEKWRIRGSVHAVYVYCKFSEHSWSELLMLNMEYSMIGSGFPEQARAATFGTAFIYGCCEEESMKMSKVLWMKSDADTKLWCIQDLLITLFYGPHGYLFPWEPETQSSSREQGEQAAKWRRTETEKGEKPGTHFEMVRKGKHFLFCPNTSESLEV